MKMEKTGRWLLCPLCNGKTRVWIREDTVMQNFLLYCPKCRQERLIEVRKYHIRLLPEPEKERNYEELKYYPENL